MSQRHHIGRRNHLEERTMSHLSQKNAGYRHTRHSQQQINRRGIRASHCELVAQWGSVYGDRRTLDRRNIDQLLVAIDRISSALQRSVLDGDILTLVHEDNRLYVVGKEARRRLV